MDYPPEVWQLYKLAGRDVDFAEWINGAESAIEFLDNNVRSDRVVIYASLDAVLLHCVLAPVARLKRKSRGDLTGRFVSPDASWRIESCSGGGEPDRVYLATPMDGEGDVVEQGEKLVFQRSWLGSDERPIELNQKLVHSLDLYFLEELNAYCRIDRDGDLQEVIKIHEIPNVASDYPARIVTILISDLFDYAHLAGMGLYLYYDFTRVDHRNFAGWRGGRHFSRSDAAHQYHGEILPGVGSYLNGRQIALPRVTKKQILRRHHFMYRREDSKFAKFISIDIRDGRVLEASCDPKKLSSYFEKPPKNPLQISPAFFNAEVLHKYKADPVKYTLSERNISCRGSWHLKTYDINEHGQVHTYLRYLGHLPFKEQMYWKSFNEKPKGFVSKRAFKTDYLGEWSTEYDAVVAVKSQVRSLDESRHPWWQTRGEKLIGTLHLPVTGSEAEWAESILVLDQITIEGFVHRSLKSIAVGLGRCVDRQWRTLKLLEECLIGNGFSESDAQETLQSLRKTHELRSIVKGHATDDKRATAIKHAKREHGSLRSHFEALASGCHRSLVAIIGCLATDTPKS